jgi:hypothetical protein
LLTLGREWNLYDSSDRRQYDIDTMLAGWRRQDDKEKALQGMQQYIERVIRGERPITMPTRLKFGYRRDLTGVVDRHGKAERSVSRDLSLAPSFDTLRSALNANRTLTTVAHELNRKRVPGPLQAYTLGAQWAARSIRTMLDTDWYAGVWQPFKADSQGV